MKRTASTTKAAGTSLIPASEQADGNHSLALSISQLESLESGPNGKLLDLTIDQLRTLAIVFHQKNSLLAAKLLGRQQSSVQGQLKTLNKHFTELCGEKLCSPMGRGEDYSFSQTGRFAAELAQQVLAILDWQVRRQRQRVLKELAVATTTFPQPFVWEAWNRVRSDIRETVQLSIHQIRTRDVGRILASEEFDLVVAPHITENQSSTLREQWAFEPLVVERLTVLTYQGNSGIVSKKAGESRLADQDKLFADEPLIVPREGIILEILDRVRPDWRRARIQDRIDDVRYGINLLRSGMTKGAMFVFEKVGEAALKGTLVAAYEEMPKEKETRLCQLYLGGAFERFRIATGLFVRKSRLEKCAQDHPFRLFCEAFAEMALLNRGKQKVQQP